MVKNLSANAYVQAIGGIIQDPHKDSYSYAQAGAGLNVNFKGTYIDANIGAGTAISAAARVGHEFKLDKNWGLDVFAKASTNWNSKSKTKSVDYPSEHYDFLKSDGTVGSFNVPAETHLYSWQPGETRIGAGAELTYKTSKAKFGVGFESGQRKTAGGIKGAYHTTYNLKETEVIDDKPEIIFSKTVPREDSINTITRKDFITPTASFEGKIGKKVSVLVDADLYKVQTGIKYTF